MTTSKPIFIMVRFHLGLLIHQGVISVYFQKGFWLFKRAVQSWIIIPLVNNRELLYSIIRYDWWEKQFWGNISSVCGWIGKAELAKSMSIIFGEDKSSVFNDLCPKSDWNPQMMTTKWYTVYHKQDLPINYTSS